MAIAAATATRMLRSFNFLIKGADRPGGRLLADQENIAHRHAGLVSLPRYLARGIALIAAAHFALFGYFLMRTAILSPISDMFAYIDVYLRFRAGEIVVGRLSLARPRRASPGLDPATDLGGRRIVPHPQRPLRDCCNCRHRYLCRARLAPIAARAAEAWRRDVDGVAGADADAEHGERHRLQRADQHNLHFHRIFRCFGSGSVCRRQAHLVPAQICGALERCWRRSAQAWGPQWVC